MTRQITHRLLLSIPVLLGVLLLGFLLLQLAPGDPAAVLAGPSASPDLVAAIRRDMGLDQPVWVQFLRYLGRVLRGDLGRSLISNKTVASELGNAIGPTIELMLACLVWSIPLGLTLGTLAAVRRGRLADRAIMAVAVAGVSMPVFTVALVLIELLGVKFRLLPFIGRGGPLWTVDGLLHVTLPAVALGFVFLGPVARMTRAAVLDVLGADHVRTARAKGLTERAVVLRHGLRNALVPVVTLIGLQAGYLLGGAVITETIFAWPGIGRLAVGAILANDFPIAQGTIMVLSLSFILINLLVDMLYVWLDPRLRVA
ncbi:MAG TPA: ABC transporter permease [Stellaceae bacterium]|nr:ABC transporter permease [Stellaceae bacterium]